MSAQHLREHRLEPVEPHPQFARHLQHAVQAPLAVEDDQLDVRAAEIPAEDHVRSSQKIENLRRKGARTQRKASRQKDIRSFPMINAASWFPPFKDYSACVSLRL